MDSIHRCKTPRDWLYLLSQATSVQLLNAYLNSVTPGINTLYADILVMEMVNKQDEERDACRNLTGVCEERAAWTEL